MGFGRRWVRDAPPVAAAGPWRPYIGRKAGSGLLERLAEVVQEPEVALLGEQVAGPDRDGDRPFHDTEDAEYREAAEPGQRLGWGQPDGAQGREDHSDGVL